MKYPIFGSRFGEPYLTSMDKSISTKDNEPPNAFAQIMLIDQNERAL
jgi:uncharacterized protein (DUF924 family)